jgi:uncharacterized Rmd1/YagE family protein
MSIEAIIKLSSENRVTFDDICADLKWHDRYEKFFGSLGDYLRQYTSVFVVSPVENVVALRTRGDTLQRRSVKPQKKREHVSVGSISYSSVGDSFDLDGIFELYERRGFECTTYPGIVHVQDRTFDMFLTVTGVAVWWGMSRRDHWVVEQDFLTENSEARAFVGHPHMIARNLPLICSAYDRLFPVWCTYEVINDERMRSMYHGQELEEKLLETFKASIEFDHYSIPGTAALGVGVMMAVSCSLARAAKVDYLELITQKSRDDVVTIPQAHRSLWKYFEIRRCNNVIEGELRLQQLAVTQLTDTPEFLWDMPWLQPYFNVTEEQNSVGVRATWFAEQLDALLQKLQLINERQHRLFMMSSDMFLIALLVLDVLSLLTRLAVHLFIL